MTVSLTEFKAKCLQLIKKMEAGGEVIEVTQNGKVVARIVPPARPAKTNGKPWELLRGSGRLLAGPEESFISESDFEAAR